MQKNDQKRKAGGSATARIFRESRAEMPRAGKRRARLFVEDEPEETGNPVEETAAPVPVPAPAETPACERYIKSTGCEWAGYDRAHCHGGKEYEEQESKLRDISIFLLGVVDMNENVESFSGTYGHWCCCSS